MSKHKKNIFTAIFCIALTIFTTNLSAVETLRSIAQLLHCSNSTEEALTHIQLLSNVPLFKPGLPSESSDLAKPLLKAETLNQLLSVLHASAIKYPENKDSIEAILLRWNFCSVVDRETYFDHWIQDGVTMRSESIGSANNWQGLKLFGVVPSSINNRFRFTTHHKDNVASLLADNYLLQSHIRQCLPHPDDSRLYRNKTKNFISRIIPISSSTQKAVEDRWTNECTAITPSSEEPAIAQLPPTNLTDQTIITEQALLAELEHEPEPQPAPKLEQESQPEPQPAPELEQESEPEPKPEPVLVLAAATVEKTQPVNQAPQPKKNLPVRKQPLLKSKSTASVPDSGIVVSFGSLESSSSEPNLPPTTPITAPQTGNALTSTNIVKSHGLSGSISLENRSFDPELTSIKLSASYKPLLDSYWFIRSAVNVSQDNKPFTYSWGLGYDDWHSGTWAFQINHWGPLKFGDGLDTGNSTMALSYKFDKDWLTNNNIGSSIGLSKTFSKEPTLSWGWSWSPHSHYFLRSTINLPIESRDINWSYGFGYSQYSKSSFSFEYNNWGLNSHSELNFKKNGQLSLIYRWEL